jgi:hypothetical protein
MSNIKISDLGQAGALTGVELLPIVQNNETVRTTLNQVKSFASIAISNNIIADAASTTISPSVNAIKTYTDGLVVGLLNDRGNYTPDVVSPGDYPSSGGSGVGGAIQKGDIWFIDGIGFLGTTPVVVGTSVRALVNNPSPTTDSDWDILDASFIQATLQAVLNAGNTANGTITLTNGSQTSILSKDSLALSAVGSNTIYGNYSFQITNNGGDYINGSTDSLKVYDVTTNNSTELKYDSLRYNNSGFIGRLSSSTLTSNQTWTLPNATGTLALANNVWNATGNAGTVAGTNFIGTTDLIDFVAKTNNTERLRVLSTGQVKLSSLTGTGTRMVVASSTGQLSTQAITSPTLQTVTDAGNTTTNSVIVKNTGSFLGLQNTAGDTRAMFGIESDNGRVVLYDTDGNNAILACANLTGDREYQLPNNDGTIALLSDINTSDSWKTIGNVGTTPGTDFIGTTDAVDLIFRTNNVEKLKITSSGDIFSKKDISIVADSNSTQTRIQIYQPTGFYSASLGQNTTNGGYLTLNGTTGFNTAMLLAQNLTAARTYQLPNASGTLALTNTTWGLTGNSGTTAGTNFIGTTDNVDLVFKTNNIERLRILSNRIDSSLGIFSKATYPYIVAMSSASTDKYVALSYDGGLSSQSGFLEFSRGGISARIFGDNIATSDKNIQLPNASGTIALTTTVTLQSVLAGTNKNLTNGINLQGTNAGGGNTGTSIINAFGTNAAQNNTGSYINALGGNAAVANSGNNINALGYAAAANNTGQVVNALGSNAAENNSGSYVNALGQEAAFNNIGNYVNTFGYNTGNGNTGVSVNAMGSNAANGNTGDYVNAIGSDASDGNSGSNVNAFGALAAFNNSGSSVNAFGVNAAKDNTISGATVFSNTSLPTYVNHAAAAVAITVLLGASVNCTYLYHNQATDSIGAVRL